MIYAKVYGCIGSAIFYKNCPQFSKDIINNNRSGCFFMEHSVHVTGLLVHVTICDYL